MSQALHILAVVVLIVLLSLSKCLWHGIRRKSKLWAGVHWTCLAGLGFFTIPLAPYDPLVIFLSSGCWMVSYLILDHEPRRDWWWQPLWIRTRLTPKAGYRAMRKGPKEEGEVVYVEETFYGKPFSDRWHVLSFLSSFPTQAAAAIAVTLPLWGTLWFWTVAGYWLALGLWIKFWLWQHPSLRPKHWN